MDERLTRMLQDADRAAGQPQVPDAAILAGLVRRRYHRRRIRQTAVGLCAAAVVAVAATMVITIQVQQRRIDRMQQQLADLTEKTDATVAFVQTILEQRQRQDQLTQLNQKLAAIPDPMGEVQARVDQTAFTMLYQADLLYKQLNLKDSAAEAYQRVIELFPDNRWAETAKQRLKDMEEQPKSKTKGDLS
jgi:tetratricopeptide (TPR) repeat protein